MYLESIREVIGTDLIIFGEIYMCINNSIYKEISTYEGRFFQQINMNIQYNTKFFLSSDRFPYKIKTNHSSPFPKSLL